MIELSLSKIRILKTAALYFSAIATGMSFAVTGPTLLDLQRIVNTDTQRIAFVYTARSNGYLFGSLAGGFLFDMTSRKQLVMTLLNLVCAVSVFAIPWSTTVPMLTVLMVINGSCLGATDTGLNVCVLHLWGKDSGPFYQALHFVYGFGGLISPLIAAQFLSHDILPDETTALYDASTTYLNNTLATDYFQSTSLLYDSTAMPDFLTTSLGFSSVASQMFNATFDSTSELLNATFAPASGLLNATFAPTSELLNTTFSPTSGIINKTLAPTTELINATFVPTSGLLNTTLAPTTELINTTLASASELINTTLAPTPEFLNSTSSFFSTLPPVTYTYAIISCVALAVSACFFFLCIVSPFDDTCQKKDDAPTRQRSTMFVAVVVFINFFLLFFETGTEIGYAQMLTTYSVKGPLHLTKTRGSYMTSCFWGTFTLSRFASIFLAIKLSSFTLLLVDLVITTLGALVLLTLGGVHEWCLWLSTVLLGVGIASFWPAAVAWVEVYIDVNNRIVSLFTVGAAFGEMFIPWLISRYIEEEPGVLGYVAVSSCVLSGILTVLMYLFLRGKQTKYLTEEEKKDVAHA